MIPEGAWSDLSSKGYVVVRSFLAEDALQVLRDDYEAGPRPDAYFIGLKPIGQTALERIGGCLDAVLATIRASTPLQVDALLKGYYFATSYVNYSWHQDFDVLAQDLVNYVNLYVPIVKPDPRRTNLAIVPYDELARQWPAAYPRLKDGFAAIFHPVNGSRSCHRVTDARDGRESVLDVDLDACAVIPDMAAGDLLIVRSDVIHRTQDNDTHRIAVSLRVVNSKSVLHRQGLESCGRLVSGQRLEADVLLRCFESLGRDTVTMHEFLAFRKSAVDTAAPGRMA